MITCSHCETLPGLLPDRGTLYIAPPLNHTLENLRNFLEKSGILSSSPHPEILAIPLVPGRLHQLSVEFNNLLSQAEMQDSKSLVVAEGVTPTLFELMQMQSLSTLISRVQGEWLIEMLLEERLITHFQPIISCTPPHKIFAYECLLRGKERDGKLIYPDRIFNAGRTSGLLFYLDRDARLTTIRNIVDYQLTCPVFINFNPSSIYDPKYCLRTTLEAVKAANIRPEYIVFEVVESEEVKDLQHLLKILSFYRNFGFRIALDDLGAGYSSLNLLPQLRPDFVKLDMELIREVDGDPYKAIIASKLIEMARDLNIKIIAEGIESEGEWHWVKEHGVDYAQGYFFSRPECPPPLPRIPE